MELYVVVPYTTNASKYVSRIGHRAFVTLFPCLMELEELLKHFERGRRYDWEEKGTSTSAVASQKTIFKKELKEADRRWLHIDPVNQHEPTLLQEIRGWQRLTREDYDAWKINTLMMGKTIRWAFEDRWLPLLPSSDPPPRVMIEVPRFRR